MAQIVRVGYASGLRSGGAPVKTQLDRRDAASFFEQCVMRRVFGSGSGAGSPVSSWVAVGPILVSLAFILFSYCFYHARSSADFMALWLAGESLAKGAPNLIYRIDPAYFTMLPPAEWIERLHSRGYRGDVYPYIYPPLWAWLAAKATGVMHYETLRTVAGALNPVLMVATVALAWRVVAPAMSLALYLAIGSICTALSSVGVYALFQDQPQILVAFLTLVAIERAEHGKPYLAGIALALAAAIKLYPALYVILWLASGKRQAAYSFVVTGVVLGGLSVAATGWPLHAQFLHVLGTVADTAVITRLSYAWESLAAQTFYWNQTHLIESLPVDPADPGRVYWVVLAKPLALSMLFKGLLVAALAGLARLFHEARCRDERAALWPLAFALLPLLSPIGWCYYYLSAVAFVPILVSRLGVACGSALIVALILGTSPFLSLQHTTSAAEAMHDIRLGQGLGTLTISAYCVVLFVIRRRRDQPVGVGRAG